MKNKLVVTLGLFVVVGFIMYMQCCITWTSVSGSIRREHYRSSEDITINGSMNVKRVTTKDLTINGSATIGPLKSQIAGDLEVNGSLTASQLNVEGKTTISGSATVKNSLFKREIWVHGAMLLQDSMVEGDLLVNAKQLQLKSNVTVKGRIEFIGKPGIVDIDGQNIHLLSGIINGEAQKRQASSVNGAELHF